MRPRFPLPLSLLALSLLLPSAAHAHALGLSRGDYRLQPDGLDAELVFAPTELGAQPAQLAQRLLQGVAVSDVQGQSCIGQVLRQTHDEAAFTLQLAYHCKARARQVELQFWDELSPGHRHLVQQSTASAQDGVALLQREQARFQLLEPTTAASERSLLSWLGLGVEHILAGHDHLAFLLGLVLVASTLRRLAGLVSLFTLAHSLTLALASLELVSLPSALVEAAIAASICYVGLENLTGRAQRSRAVLVFGFGLIHGFGFAGALRELGLSAGEAPLALLGFNLGVELGQLLLLAATFLLLQRARHSAWFQRKGQPLLNGAVAVAGLCWLAARVLESSAFAG
jgi:hydrogenase/urease accessory protein HupE